MQGVPQVQEALLPVEMALTDEAWGLQGSAWGDWIQLSPEDKSPVQEEFNGSFH